ncbi:tyrosine-type recombinase/integrase [Pseudooceanicola sp. CBS1P-1]|uniref:Tyrosine-type recombinase/integrase n=1 Tax=Pseudooceanicola albus TaxID=2692189 RepID=A0A6L7G4C7_9RHOB|nr:MULTISPECIES: tyrosine-type recombinase/integrase [Pseudooceanicola]MBT9385625.1 tyrosine-type recombinase/integrase [Pseudooceanicola endophyticus]MXN18965.1 tyrosine-type recombinase/integrase [Pseudooceanicola albus]
MTKKTLPKYVYSDRGYVRFIRKTRGQSVMMHEEPGTLEFWDHYNRLLKGREPLPTKRNFETLILSYFESDAFQKLKPRTKSDYRKYIEHIRTIWGPMDPAKIEPHHVYKLHQANADRWRQANYLVQVLVVLMNHARLIGFLKKEHGNPAKGIPLFKQESEGWEPWPDDVRAEFEAVATPRALLVYELCIGTGQRIGDVLKIRWSDIKGGAYGFTQGKTNKALEVPLTDRLKAHLASIEKKGLTVITDAQGRPVSYRTIAEEMRKVKAAMQHQDAQKYVTHGLRKNATIELYLAGCDDEMVQAVTGHSGVEMLKKYGGMTRQKELAKRAQEARNRMEQNKPRT